MTNAPTAVVRAAGQRIGAGIARHSHSVGYRLVLLSNDHGAGTLAGELGWIGLKGSVTCAEDIERTVREAEGALGRIDLVVNNTGLASPAGAYITGQNLRVDGGLARPMSPIPLR